MENPRIYNEGSNVQKRNVSSVIEEYSEELMNVTGKCMDLGCGPGNITKDILLPSLGSSAHIIGVDISEHMVKYANEKYNDEKRLQFEVLNAETKSLPKKYISEFDHIFSFRSLNWCSDIRQAVTNIYQMLQPNGFTLLQIVVAQDYLEIIPRLIRDIRFAQYVPEKIKNILPYQEFNCTRKGFKELLQSEGFTVHHCSRRNEINFEEKSGPFIGTLLSITHFLQDMPQDLVDQFKDAIFYIG
ncbi:PREDICTED: probable polyketide synthase 40 isoform X2 [Vollenhovia emeryi]|uniref:probable polyketide synthase 40 isoform X2 n=1 Tax=Vollenhovia emeryi TaxID=411798 RepID=UPI0005F4138E|nr:PREDICTED: probable polyketide synthase 40 isoform X2 [Vollenhovia emeryi]